MSSERDEDPNEASPRIHLRAMLGASASASLRRAQAALATTDRLPVRPSVAWFKNRAKDRQEQARKSDPEAPLSAQQLAIAREFGYANWPKFDEAIKGRNRRAGELARHVQGRNEARVLAAFERDRAAILDVGVAAAESDLRFLASVGMRSGPAEASLGALLLAVIWLAAPEELSKRLYALPVPSADLDAAEMLLLERIQLAAAEGRKADEDHLEDARSVLSTFDGDDHEYMSDGD